MPKKFDKCVEELIKTGKSESSAYAICTKSIGNDAVGIGENKIDPSTGFMHTPVTICRSGLQPYTGYELGMDGENAKKVFNVLRHPDDVTDLESVATYQNLVVTDEHPSDRWVYIENVKDLQKGQVSNITIENDTIKGLMTITDEDLIDKVQKGKIEVSLGYAYKLLAEDGFYNGEPYQFRYTDMVANHLSIVEKGRCGRQCSITDSNYDTIVDENPKERSIDMKIKINGKEFEVDEELGKAIMAERSTKDEEMDEATKKAEDMEEEKVEAVKANDMLQARLDSANDSKLSDEDIDKMVTERAGLIAFATGIIGNDSIGEVGSNPMAIKKAVCEKHFGVSMDGKSEAYIDARFDIVNEDQIAADASVKKLEDDMKKEKDDVATDNEKIATDARNTYLKKKGME